MCFTLNNLVSASNRPSGETGLQTRSTLRAMMMDSVATLMGKTVVAAVVVVVVVVVSEDTKESEY